MIAYSQETVENLKRIEQALAEIVKENRDASQLDVKELIHSISDHVIHHGRMVYNKTQISEKYPKRF